ncbi:MAG TPA: sigma-70 family RNA polymerase sigma factor [Amnibacterium sp.]
MAAPALDEVFRREWPRLVAVVARTTGDLALAEDAVQEAFARAAAARDREILINPAAWLTTVAKRIAIDALRREARLTERLPLLAAEEPPAVRDVAGDDRLALLFAVCTPALEPDARLALALRFVCGVPTAEIAAVLLVSHPAMSARLTRAKRRITEQHVRFTVPAGAELAARLPDVLATVHLLYTTGHTAAEGADLRRTGVTRTAVELARALRGVAPADLEVAGLLALLLLTEARAPGRVRPDGSVASLEVADRSTWDPALLEEGLGLATAALAGGGRFALEAGISGLHTSAPDFAAADWPAICLLYDRLVERWPSPAAEVARLVARSFLPGEGPAALDGLAELEVRAPAASRQVAAARADLLRRMQRVEEARAAYAAARSVERNAAVRDFYGARIAELDQP